MKVMASENIAGEYHVDGYMHYCMSYYLYIFEDYSYQLYLIIQDSEDQLMQTTLSFGTVQKTKRGEIIFTDRISQIKMTGYYRNNEILMKNSFVFLQNEIFKKTKTPLNRIYFERDDTLFSECVPKENQKHTQLEKVRHKFGTFENLNRYEMGMLYNLTISQDGNFSLSIFSEYENCYCIVSKGIWKIVENEILLEDKSVNYVYKMQITKDGYLCTYLPGIFLTHTYFVLIR
jgi:hypothetical protein